MNVATPAQDGPSALHRVPAHLLVVHSEEPEPTRAGRALAEELHNTGLHVEVAAARHAQVRARTAKQAGQLDAVVAIGQPSCAALAAVDTDTPLAVDPSTDQLLAAVAAGLPVASHPILRVRADQRPPVIDFSHCTLSAPPGSSIEVIVPGRRPFGSTAVRALTCDPLGMCPPSPSSQPPGGVRLCWTDPQTAAEVFVLLRERSVVRVVAAPGSHVRVAHDGGRVRGIARSVTIGPNPALQLVQHPSATDCSSEHSTPPTHRADTAPLREGP